jgi:hypothetical protein
MSEQRDEQGADWRSRVRQVGKAAFIREEMARLGFWSLEEEGGDPAVARALAELSVKVRELRELRAELARLDADIGAGRDLPRLIAEIRRRRIERVRAAREEKAKERARAAEERRAQDRRWRQETLPFLGRGVSGGLRYEGGDPSRVVSLGLPSLATAAEVASAIGISTGELAWLTYHRGAATIDHYHRFELPKRSGGTRVIAAPKGRLRVAQEWLLATVLDPLPVHPAAMAFRPGRSIVQNAAAHAARAVVARIDLEGFFPSITFRRVKGLFESFGYNEGVATLLALLATEPPRAPVTVAGAAGGSSARFYVSLGARRLPQGACTSPAITNLLCRRLDARLAGVAAGLQFAYTRYADDLVFSHADRDAPVGELLVFAREIVTEEGFRVNEAKTRVMRPQHRQSVTGLVVNGTPAIARPDLRRFRAFLHQCETEGLPAVTERLGRSALAYAAGYLAYVAMVSPGRAARLREAHPWITRPPGR